MFRVAIPPRTLATSVATHAPTFLLLPRLTETRADVLLDMAPTHKSLMHMDIPEPSGDFDDNPKTCFESALDEFESAVDALRQKGRTRELQSLLRWFEKKLLLAAEAGIPDHNAYAAAARVATPAGSRFAYFARAYKLLAEQSKVPRYENMPCCVMHHYQLADYAFEMGRIQEGDGEMKKAAELYACSLQHLQDGADACDAHLNDNNPGVSRRRGYTASLERVRKFLE